MKKIKQGNGLGSNDQDVEETLGGVARAWLSGEVTV